MRFLEDYMEHISIGEAAVILGVSVTTMRRWDKAGILEPAFRTPGNHRRYQMDDVLKLTGTTASATNQRVIGYARVSSHDQKKDLAIQAKRIECHLKGICDDFEVIEDLGSGLNYKKRGLKKLIEMIVRREVKLLAMTHKDRLLRFGSEIIFQLCRRFGTEVIVLEQQEETFEQSLVGDVLELMTVFTARLHGSRSHKNRKIVDKAA